MAQDIDAARAPNEPDGLNPRNRQILKNVMAQAPKTDFTAAIAKFQDRDRALARALAWVEDKEGGNPADREYLRQLGILKEARDQSGIGEAQNKIAQAIDHVELLLSRQQLTRGLTQLIKERSAAIPEQTGVIPKKRDVQTPAQSVVASQKAIELKMRSQAE